MEPDVFVTASPVTFACKAIAGPSTTSTNATSSSVVRASGAMARMRSARNATGTITRLASRCAPAYASTQFAMPSITPLPWHA